MPGDSNEVAKKKKKCNIIAMLGSLIGGLAGLFGATANAVLQADSNARNYGVAQQNLDFQREALDYNKWLNAESWKRDDTAVQRRMADLEAAGLNPLLAVGSAAGNSSPIRVDSLENKMDWKAIRLEQLDQIAQRALQMDQTQFVNENINARTDYTNALTTNVQATTDQIAANTGKAYFDMWNQTYELYKAGKVSGVSLGQIARNVAGVLGVHIESNYLRDFDALNDLMINIIWSKYGANIVGDEGLSGLKNGAVPSVVDNVGGNGRIVDQLPYESGSDYLMRGIFK